MTPRYKLTARGMNKMFNTVSEEKHFLLEGVRDQVLEDIHKKAFADWPQFLITSIEETA